MIHYQGKILSRYVGLLLILISIAFNSQARADSIENIQPPTGIRHYDKGQAPDFKLNDMDGNPLSLKENRGRWVFLHFWASWCGPCRKEMPVIQKLADRLESDKFKIIMVNTAEDEDTIFEFLASIGVELNSLMDTDGQVTEVWKPRGLPSTFLINPEGKIKYQAIGGRNWVAPEYIDFLNKLIASSL